MGETIIWDEHVARHIGYHSQCIYCNVQDVIRRHRPALDSLAGK